MMKSDVFFVRTATADSAKRKSALQALLAKVRPFEGYKRDEIIPVKITIGESACIHNAGPELVKTVIAEIRKREAKPFLFDTSVIYQGLRQNAVDHLALAQQKGFDQRSIGAPFIIADGLLGQDGKEFQVNTQHIKKINVPSFVGMLDSLVVISHVTGHIVSGYAGAIKNVAMGMSCRMTKQVQHSSLKPRAMTDKCTACGCCIAICPVRAISFKDERAFIDEKICVGCGECLCACKFNAIFINWKEDPLIFSKRMVDVAHCILPKFRNKFFVNFAFDITRECDCISTKDDMMIARDIGILASEDILSLDKATADLAIAGKMSDFLNGAKNTYEGMFEYAAKCGLGNPDYNLIEI